MKLVLSKNIYAELLAHIDKGNNDLRELTHQNRYLEPVRHKRRSQRHSVDFKLIRRRAGSLYNVLVAGRCWKCSCRKYRVASLRLEPRPWEQDNNTALGEPKLRFRVLISKRREESNYDITCKCQEIEIEPVDASLQPPPATGNIAQPPSLATPSIASSYVSEPVIFGKVYIIF